MCSRICARSRLYGLRIEKGEIFSCKALIFFPRFVQERAVAICAGFAAEIRRTVLRGSVISSVWRMVSTIPDNLAQALLPYCGASVLCAVDHKDTERRRVFLKESDVHPYRLQ